MQFTTVRSKEKDYDIYLKSEKLVHSQQEEHEVENVPSYFSYLEERKKWILRPKMQFTTGSYLKSIFPRGSGKN